MNASSIVSTEARDEILYHLRGLAEGGAEIARILPTLEGGLAGDLEVAAQALTDLEVQIYFHLAYHMKELRKPFSKVHRAAYDALEKKAPSKRTRRRARRVASVSTENAGATQVQGKSRGQKTGAKK